MYDMFFLEGWYEWVVVVKVKFVYGVKLFLKYVDKKGIDIYYIFDCDKEKDFKVIKENLKNIGLL